MTRESRLLVTLVLIAGAGTSGLMLVANQYRKALVHAPVRHAVSDQETVRAVRLVDGYLAARRAVKHVVERYPEKTEEMAVAYRTERFNTLSSRGLTLDDYARVRSAWRAYRSGGSVNDEALVAVFRARGPELYDAGLGPVEALDEAIK